MKRLFTALLVLAVALSAAALAAPALANDFIKPTPVPSSRDTSKPVAKTKKTPNTWGEVQANKKIVRTTKSANGVSGVPANKTPASLQ